MRATRYVAGDPGRRAGDLMAMFADPEVDVIQCFQGGHGSAQLIPHLDFDAIAASPKALATPANSWASQAS